MKNSGDMKEIKNEVFNKLDKEVGQNQKEVMEQCDLKAVTQEWKSQNCNTPEEHLRKI